MADPLDDDPPRSPPPETLRAIQEQTTPDLTRNARRYAERRAQAVRAAGLPIPKHYDRELLDDAHADTWTGEAPWDPSRCSLLVHLCGVIKKRTWLETLHARRHRRASIDVSPNDRGWLVAPDIVERQMRDASQGDVSPIMVCALVVRVCHELRRVTGADPGRLAILQCWENGLTERAEVMALTGLDEVAYHRARIAVMYLSRQLPPELREVVEATLRSAS